MGRLGPLERIAGYVGIHRDIWGLGFRVRVPNNQVPGALGNSSCSTGLGFRV